MVVIGVPGLARGQVQTSCQTCNSTHPISNSMVLVLASKPAVVICFSCYVIVKKRLTDARRVSLQQLTELLGQDG